MDEKDKSIIYPIFDKYIQGRLDFYKDHDFGIICGGSYSSVNNCFLYNDTVFDYTSSYELDGEDLYLELLQYILSDANKLIDDSKIKVEDLVKGYWALQEDVDFVFSLEEEEIEEY